MTCDKATGTAGFTSHRRHRHPGQEIMGQPQRVPGAERRPAGGELIQRRAQRVQVGPLIHRPAGPPGLLRRQVRQRPGDLAVRGELRADLRERGRQREVHQARGPVAGDHDVRWTNVPVHHPRAVHPGHRPGQPGRQPGQLTGRQRPGQPSQAHAARIRQHDRARVPRRLRQLRDPFDTAQPLQHRPLVPEPAVRVRPQRLLADDRAPSQEQPSHACAAALMHDLGPDGRILVRQHPACAHPTPPRPAGAASYPAYTQLRAKATIHQNPAHREAHQQYPVL